jgi:hypothetical protein
MRAPEFLYPGMSVVRSGLDHPGGPTQHRLQKDEKGRGRMRAMQPYTIDL